MLLVTLGACRTFQNPGAQVIDQDTKITAAADLTSSLLRYDIITPDEAEIALVGIEVSKKHVDNMRAVLIVAKKENRKPTDMELAQARSYRQLSVDALKLVSIKLGEYQARKAK